MESDISSYENGKAPSEQFMETSQPRTPEQDDRAHEHQGLKYFTFDSTDPEQVKEAIWQGKGCILALEGNNPCWTTQDGIVEIPETTTWGHFLVLTGRKKINRSYYWEACNSWGLVGDNGYYYIPEEYLNKGLGYNEWTFIEAPAQEYSMLQQIIILLSKIIGLIKK